MDLRALQARLSGNLATVPSRLRGPAAVNMTCQAAYADCAQPGASVTKVALAHGINANVVHRWRQLVREGTLGGMRPLNTP